MRDHLNIRNGNSILSLTDYVATMFSLKARSLLGTQFWRRLNNSTYRCLTSSASSNVAPNVYENKNECLVINWRNGHVDEFPYVYLRENCRCSGCYTDERKSRTMNSPKEVDLNITVQSFTWSNEDNELEVNWGDGHISRYSLKWLNYLRYVTCIDQIIKSDIKLLNFIYRILFSLNIFYS